MYCSNCNSNIMNGASKCPFCGNDLTSAQSAPQQNTYNPPPQYTPYNNNNYGGYSGYNNYAPPPMPRTVSTGKTNTLGLIASIAVFIAIFLPFFKITVGISVSASLFDGKDWLLFTAIAVLGLIFSLIKKHTGVFVVGLISVILTIGEAILASEHRLKSKLGEYWEEISSYVKISYDYGFYILLVASVLLLVAGIHGISQNKKSSF